VVFPQLVKQLEDGDERNQKYHQQQADRIANKPADLFLKSPHGRT